MLIFYRIAESLLLALSLTTDAFAAALAYGAGKIRIPPASVAVISLVCSGMLAASMAAGRFLSGAIPQWVTNDISFWLLLAMGLARLFDSTIKAYIRRHNRLHLSFSAMDLRFVLTVYANAETADLDHSNSLSPREAALLAAALSLDGLAVGFGAAVSGGSILLTALLSLLLTTGAIRLGCALGRRIGALSGLDLSVVSGLLLLLLAALRLPL